MCVCVCVCVCVRACVYTSPVSLLLCGQQVEAGASIQEPLRSVQTGPDGLRYLFCRQGALRGQQQVKHAQLTRCKHGLQYTQQQQQQQGIFNSGFFPPPTDIEETHFLVLI